MSSGDYKLVSKPGFYHDDENKWLFVCNEDTALPIPDAVKNAHFEEKEFDMTTAKSVITDYFDIVDKYHAYLLAFLRTCALLYTPISVSFKIPDDNKKVVFKKVVVIYGCDSDDKKKAVSTWLKVYNRDNSGGSPIHKLSTLKKSQIKSIVDTNKDNFVIFEDNSSSAKGTTKLSESENEKMQYIADLFVRNKDDDNDDVECLCAVISDRYMMQGSLSDECFLFVDASNLKSYELNTINEACYQFDQLLVYYIKNGFSMYNGSLVDTHSIKSDFSSSVYSLETILSALMILDNICQFYRANEKMEKFKERIISELYSSILSSEKFNNEDNIVTQFTKLLNNIILSEKLNVVYADSDNVYDDKSIFIKDGYLLIRTALLEDMIKKSVTFVADKKGVRLRAILDDRGMLKTNVKDRYLYKTSLMRGKPQEHFVAVSTNILNEQAKVKMSINNDKDNYPVINLRDGMERIRLGTLPSLVYLSIRFYYLTNKFQNSPDIFSISSFIICLIIKN